ncbi:MAG: hypothetical protein NC402_03310 [Prevotella sp.]|nr:hypothetical protein [Prevotella sp.]MCM1075574.1 hypothetical protein [Ruminococcus sp.]
MHNELRKVNTEQIFQMWRNVAIPILTIILLHVLTSLFSPLFAPVISTLVAIFLYYQVVSNAFSKIETCAIVPYIFFLIVVSYTIVLIVINLLAIWGILNLPDEFIFFDGQYLQGLIMAPVGLVTSIIVYLNRKKLTLCINCKITAGTPLERGHVGLIYSNESSLQMKNLIFIYLLITIVNYIYYLTDYVDLSISQRDRFIFSGVAILIYLFDVAYFGVRYYNLFLDLKESDELISPDDLNAMGTRTYLRYYVICDDSLYMSSTNLDNKYDADSDIIDTPFTIRRNVSGFQEYEIKQFIQEQTGVKNGELRFFYGRKVADAAGRKVLRYFYFLPGETEEYPELKVRGKWVSSDKLKTIYNNTPDRLSTICLSDISRLARIIVTRKIYKIDGERRNKLTQYRPSFTLREVKTDDIDFQKDDWIRVSMFNSDTSFFKLKRWWRNRFRNSYSESGQR